MPCQTKLQVQNKICETKTTIEVVQLFPKFGYDFSMHWMAEANTSVKI